MLAPTTNGSNGRDASGRFAPGNAGGPGNPYAKRVARLRTALVQAIKPGDVAEVVNAMLRAAKGGDVAAARMIRRMNGWKLSCAIPTRSWPPCMAGRLSMTDRACRHWSLTSAAEPLLAGIGCADRGQ
jgi:hypothetical protein